MGVGGKLCCQNTLGDRALQPPKREQAEGSSVARGFFLNISKKKFVFLAYDTPRPPMSIHKKFQPNPCRRLAGYTQHLYLRMSCFII